MENLVDWAHSNVFKFLTQHPREDILRETYMSNGGLTGCLRQLQLKFDRRQNIIFHIPLNKFRPDTAFFLHSLPSSSFFDVKYFLFFSLTTHLRCFSWAFIRKTEKTTINLCLTYLQLKIWVRELRTKFLTLSIKFWTTPHSVFGLSIPFYVTFGNVKIHEAVALCRKKPCDCKNPWWL